MKIAIVGDGAVGLFLAVLLARSNEVSVFSRKPTPIGTTKNICLTGFIESPQNQIQVLAADADSTKGVLAVSDVVFVCVKTTHFESLGPTLASMNGIVVLTQNGLGIVDLAHQRGLSTRAHVVRMLCRFGVFVEEPYSVRVSGSYAATLASQSQSSAALVHECLESAGFGVAREGSVEKAEWVKAIINVFVNPLASLMNAENRVVIEDLKVRSMALSLVDEARRVASAEGVDLSSVSVGELERSVQPFRTNINSFLADLRLGRTPEIDSLLGEILRRGAQHQIPLPVTQVVHGLLSALSERRLLMQAV